MKLSKKAYAKINLTLEILGTKRNDGFHDIASVMHKASGLFDEVSLEITETGIDLECDKEVCAKEDNLAYKAAQRYMEKYTSLGGKPFGVKIAVKKNIPAGAGLAGGSSDAAAVLDGLYELKGGISEEDVYEIALSLGSDVPFCLEKHKCALCTGRGEKIEDLPEIKMSEIVFYLPSTPLSTAGIYGEYDKLYGDDYSKDKSIKMAELIKKGAEASEIAQLMCNDFQKICISRCPEIAEGIQKLKEKGYLSQMSGSGSAVFGIK